MHENDKNGNITVDFLLKEFELLEKLRSNASKLSGDRVQYFFLIISTFAAAATWITKGESIDSTSYLAILVINLFLLIIGILSFFRILEAHFSIVTYTRGLNRIRKYFSSLNEYVDINEALLLPTDDRKPKYGGFGDSQFKVSLIGLTGMMVFMVSALSGSLLALIFGQFMPTTSSYLLLAIGLLGFYFVLVSLLLYSCVESERREKNFDSLYRGKEPEKKEQS